MNRTGIKICTVICLGILCWVGSGPGWGQSPEPDLNSLPPQERIRLQSSPTPADGASPVSSSDPSSPDSGSDLGPEITPQPQDPVPSEPDPAAPPTPLPNPRLARPGITVQRLGNLHFAIVSLDGYELIEVAAEIPGEVSTGPDSTLPISRRVEEIKNRLEKAVSQLIRPIEDPSQFRVVKAVLNNEVVLVMRQGDRNTVLLTVTQADADLANTTIDQLADTWEITIGEGLLRAWRQRQPPYIQARLRGVGLIGVGIISLLFLLGSIQKWAKSRWDQIQHQIQLTVDSMEVGSPNPPDPTITSELSEDSAIVEARDHLKALRQKQDLILLVRRLLSFAQIIQITLGATLILIQFPQSREFGLRLFGLPFVILLLSLFTSVSTRLAKLFIDYLLGRWLEEQVIVGCDSTRASAKSHTYSLVFRDLMDYLSFAFFVVVVLYNLEVPLSSLLTGAGLFGLFLSLATQSTIKDILSGVGILIEDQYALGDWVILNDSTCGVVERVDLVYTKIRNMHGSLVTIANGEINKVENMTVDWARVWFSIDVAYQADIDKVIDILQRQAEILAEDVKWKPVILNPVELIGVDRLAHDGMRLRLWIQTKAGWQWAVERELRLRIRKAFESYGISIGIPQQEIPQLNQALSPGAPSPSNPTHSS